MKKKVHVIQNTHWDFEWYFTNNESFIQLVYHLDEVLAALEDEKLDFYLLDGQMSILDEYLESCPEQKERIEKLVRAGKLQIGPWYTQTDELIIAGESIVRNLNLGIDLAEELGGYMPIGYLPDSFGQGKDMPKIYNGFNIEQAVFWRGVPEEATTAREFIWKSEDGSEVVVSNIKNGYFVGVGLIYEERYQELMDTIEHGATGNHLVLSVGGDQRYVDFDLKERIDLFNQNLSDYELVESTYEQFFSELKQENLPTVSGEFISGSVSKIHRSIYSSRYDHKYLNDKIERRMIYQVEPLMTMAEQWAIPYKKGVVDRIWKLLSKCQAHDSAGGCNSDKTNKIILERLIEADQLSYSIVDYLTRKIAESRPDKKEHDLVLFNPLPWNVKKVIQVNVSTEYSKISLKNQEVEIPVDILETRKENSGSIKRDASKMDPNQFYYIHTIAFMVDLPAFGYQVYEINATENSNHQPHNMNQIENEQYTICFKNGTLSLKDKFTHLCYENFLTFEDGGDEGDTYDYSPAYKDDTYELDFSEALVDVYTGDVQSKMTLQGHWKIAADLAERAEKKRSQQIPYKLELRLNQASSSISCHLEIENRACDHRMRAVMHLPFGNQYSYTDTPFGTIRRGVEDPHIHDWRQLNWKEEPTTIFPMLHYVNAHDDSRSVTLFSKGIKEYQFIGQKFDQIALTLFRSVGYLGRPDLLRRPGIASGNEFKYIETPDSLLLQKLTFKFAIQMDPTYQPAKLQRDYLDYALTIPYYQLQELNRFTTTLKYFVSNPLPTPVSFSKGIKLESETLVFSSLKKASFGNGYEVRVYNPDATNSVVGGKLLLPDEHWYDLVNLRGISMEDKKYGKEIDLGIFKPGEIKTFRILD